MTWAQGEGPCSRCLWSPAPGLVQSAAWPLFPLLLWSCFILNESSLLAGPKTIFVILLKLLDQSCGIFLILSFLYHGLHPAVWLLFCVCANWAHSDSFSLSLRMNTEDSQQFHCRPETSLAWDARTCFRRLTQLHNQREVPSDSTYPSWALTRLSYFRPSRLVITRRLA